MKRAALLLSFLVLVYFAVLGRSVAPTSAFLWTIAGFVLLACPGIFIGLALFGWDISEHPESVIFGSVIGIALSSFVALLVGFLVRWSASLIVVALLVFAAVAFLVARHYRKAPLVSSFRPWTAADYTLLAAMALMTLVFTTIPFLRVGELTPKGYAYCWLFGFDFLLRAAYTTSITIQLPPDLIHLSGIPLHMYLGGYVLPAFSYSLAGKKVPIHSVLIISQLLLNITFVSCLLASWRVFAKSVAALAKTALVALVAYSYYWTFAWARHAVSTNALAPLSSALSGHLLQTGDVSHLYQRMFLVEPQAITGLSVFLVILTLTLAQQGLLSLPLSCIIGLVIGAEFGIDSWLALNLTLWFAAAQILRNWQNLRSWIFWRNSVITAVVCVSTWVSFFAIRMVSSGGAAMLSVGIHWNRIELALIQYPIEYGPLLLLGVWGLWSWLKTERTTALVLWIFVFLILAQDLFVRIGDLPQFRTGNRLLPLVFLIAIAWSFDQIQLRTKFRTAVSFCILLFAVPTFFTDIHGTSSVTDESRTYYVRAPDRDACDWIRNNLPQDAIVQSEPNYSGQAEWRENSFEMSLIPDFAERRSILGEEYAAESVCPECKKISRARYAAMQEMLNGRESTQVWSIASQYKINYLYVGPYEQNRHPSLLPLLQKSSGLFDEVYSRDGVHIYKIANSAGVVAQQ